MVRNGETRAAITRPWLTTLSLSNAIRYPPFF